MSTHDIDPQELSIRVVLEDGTVHDLTVWQCNTCASLVLDRETHQHYVGSLKTQSPPMTPTQVEDKLGLAPSDIPEPEPKNWLNQVVTIYQRNQFVVRGMVSSAHRVRDIDHYAVEIVVMDESTRAGSKFTVPSPGLRVEVT